MGDEIPRHTLGDYSRPSHEAYRNTIELLDGNNVVPLRSDTIQLVQNGCSFHGLWSEDLNQYLKDFLNIVNPLDLNVDNEERARLIEKENDEVIDEKIIIHSECSEKNDEPTEEPVRATAKGPLGEERKLVESLEPQPAMLNKRITKKIDIGGNFVIPCNVGGLKYMDALVDQGSDVNVMPLTMYNRLTDEKLVETNIRLSLASQWHIYPLRITEDVLVEVASFVYPVDFVILDIKEDRRKPLILGTPFLTTARAEIKFDKGTITLKSGKSKVNFHKWLERFCEFEGRKEDEINTLSIVNERILEWEERIKFHHEEGLEFDNWKNKLSKNNEPVPKMENSSSGRDENQGGVT
ncbi:MAK10-like protein [Tanacetum coccineum]